MTRVQSFQVRLNRSIFNTFHHVKYSSKSGNIAVNLRLREKKPSAFKVLISSRAIAKSDSVFGSIKVSFGGVSESVSQ